MHNVYHYVYYTIYIQFRKRGSNIYCMLHKFILEVYIEKTTGRSGLERMALHECTVPNILLRCNTVFGTIVLGVTQCLGPFC